MKTLSTLFIGLALLFSTGFSSPPGYKVGDLVTDFKLKNIDDKMVSLSSYKDQKGVVVIFTCNHCPYSKLYEDRIMELDKKFRPMGYPVVAINPNDPVKVPEDSYENMQRRAKNRGYTFPYLLDETQDVAKAFGATRTPHVFLLDKKQDKFRVSYIGAIDDSPQSADAAKKLYVEEAILALDKGKSVETPETKAIGCTIKWK